MKIPANINRLIRIYDNEKYGDHLTVVFTKPFHVNPINKQKFFSYIGMSSAPFHPQGICQHGECEGAPIDRLYGNNNKPKNQLGKRLKFEDLNKDCQQVILQDLEYE